MFLIKNYVTVVVDAYGQDRLLVPSCPMRGPGHSKGLTLDLQLQKRECKTGIEAARRSRYGPSQEMVIF